MRTTRRLPLLRLSSLVALVVLASVSPWATGTAQAGPLPPGVERPDIVVLIIDDLAQMDDRLWDRLPTVRRLFLKSGVRFTDYVGNDPLCCPGRATLLTGQRTIHHGVLQNDARLFDPRVSIATELRAAGYWTGIFGKYFNQTAALRDHSPPGWDRAFINGGGYWDYESWLDGTPVTSGVRDEDYSTTVIRRQAIAGLRAAPADRPRFVWLAPFAVHAGYDQQGVMAVSGQPSPVDVGAAACETIPGWSTAATREEDITDKPAHVQAKPKLRAVHDLRRTCQTLLSVDRLLRGVIGELKAQGRPEPMVILTSDNGMAWGAHHWQLKRVPYATPMPLFIRWPDVLGTAPATVRTTVSSVDIAPTLCAIAGCTMGPFRNGFGVDGISILPLLLDVGAVNRGAAKGGAARARARSGRRTITRNRAGVIKGLALDRSYVIEEHRSTVDAGDPPPWRGVRTTDGSPLGRWVYTEYVTGEKELYDISGGPCWTWSPGDAGDPCQLDNRAGDPAYARIQQQLADIVATFD